MHQVEDVVEHGDPAAAGSLAVSHLHAPLEAGEAGPAALESDDLAVHDEVCRALAAEGLGHLRVGAVEALAVA